MTSSDCDQLPQRMASRIGISLPVLGFGAFKIGRNVGIKYPNGYELPSDSEAERILNGILDAGLTHIDTAPAYGISEDRIGRLLRDRQSEFTLSTKVGELFEDGVSRYQFDERSVRSSLERSRERLQRETLDLVTIHSNGDDLRILQQTDVVPILKEYRSRGIIHGIGFSGKTVVGARTAMGWADVLMVEFNTSDTSHADVIQQAAARGIGVIVKKGLASGHLPAPKAIPFVLQTPGVSSLVIGGLNLDHIQANIETARQCCNSHSACHKRAA